MVAVLIVPLLILGGLEAGLRLGGYGFPTSFFIERQQQGGDAVLVENDKFGWRFFPREAARSPSPLLLQAVKPSNTFRIFLFGESAALGDPKPAYGVSRYLEALLEERFSGMDFEVVCVAMTAINSHAILPLAHECARHGGDLWIVYMGNNEMEGPFGANTIFGPRAPQLGVIRASLALRATKLGQLLEDFGRRIKGPSDGHASWEGMKMFAQQQLPPDDPRKQIVYAHFRRNLEDIVRVALRSGAQPVLCTVASNLKDCPPFASLNSLKMTESERLLWEGFYQRGREFEATNQYPEALRLFEEAATLDSQFAQLQFRAGRCALNLTNLSRARSHFERARDCDALPFRTDTTLNAIAKDVANQFAGKGVHLVDAEMELARQSTGGVPGEEFFFDHVHLTFEGNYRLARLLAQTVGKLLPESQVQKRTDDWASSETCERRLGLTDWNRSAVYETMLQRLSDAPFTNQLNHVARAEALIGRIRQFRSRMQPSVMAEARAGYEKTLADHPKDPRLSENFAEFLEATGDLGEAAAHWQRVANLWPHHYAGYFHVGRVLGRQRKHVEARRAFEEALRLRPDLAEAHLELGQLAATDGKHDEALKAYAEAQRLRPTDARVPLRRADVFAKQGKRAAAIESLREAIRLRPSLYEAHYLLGVELAVDNKLAEAQTEFQEVLRFRPGHALAHLNLGVALARQRRLDDALLHFKEVLRLDPENEKARKFIENLEQLRGTPAPQASPPTEP